MYVSPINLVDGLIEILNKNMDSVQQVINHYLGDYPQKHHLSVFKGMRKSIPLSMFPCIQFQPTSASNEWTTTSAQTGEYSIQCTLTVSCDNDEYGAEYISELTRRIVQIYTYPSNMCFEVPNEYSDNDNGKVYVQFGTISSVTYNAVKDGTLRVAQWDWTGRIIETFPQGKLELGPSKMNYKKDKLL